MASALENHNLLPSHRRVKYRGDHKTTSDVDASRNAARPLMPAARSSGSCCEMQSLSKKMVVARKILRTRCLGIVGGASRS